MHPQKHIPDDVWQLIYSFDPQYAKLQRIITINCPSRCNSQINYFISYYMKKILILNEILQFPHWYVGRCLKLPNGSTRTTIGFCNRTYKQATELYKYWNMDSPLNPVECIFKFDIYPKHPCLKTYKIRKKPLKKTMVVKSSQGIILKKEKYNGMEYIFGAVVSVILSLFLYYLLNKK